MAKRRCTPTDPHVLPVVTEAIARNCDLPVVPAAADVSRGDADGELLAGDAGHGGREVGAGRVRALAGPVAAQSAASRQHALQPARGHTCKGRPKGQYTSNFTGRLLTILN